MLPCHVLQSLGKDQGTCALDGWKTYKVMRGKIALDGWKTQGHKRQDNLFCLLLSSAT